LRWLTQAAEQSLPEAWYRLAQRTDNEEKSVYWYTRAALAGHTAAQGQLGVCFLGEGVGKEAKRLERAARETVAVKWFQRAAHHGDVAAMCNIGLCHDRGIGGVGHDPLLAVAWFQRAAEGGNLEGMFNLAQCLRNGIGLAPAWVRSLPETATKWYRRAGKRGHIDACYHAGQASEASKTECGEAEAIEWYTKAAMQGHEPAA